MPPEYRGPIKLNQEVSVYAASGLVEVGPGVFVADEFTTTIDYSGAGDEQFSMTVTAKFAVRDGKPVLLEATFRSPDGLPVRRLQREWKWPWLIEHATAAAAEGDVASIEWLRRDYRNSRQTTLDPQHFRKVAKLYAEGGTAPVKHIAEQMQVKYGTARRWANEARNRGYLKKGDR